MGLSIKNSFTAEIELVFVYYDETCGNYLNGPNNPPVPNSPWRKTGWIHIPVGQTVQIWDGDLQNANRYYYAFGSTHDGSAIWAGTVSCPVPSEDAFNRAIWDNDGCDRSVDLFQIDINGDDNYTLELTP